MAFEVRLDTVRLDQIIQVLPNMAETIVHKAASNIKERAQASMVGGGKPHVPSLPGEPPHRDIGNLAASIDVREVSKLERQVGDGVEYGLPLEFGSEDGTLAARPWLIPALEKERKPYKQAWKALFR